MKNADSAQSALMRRVVYPLDGPLHRRGDEAWLARGAGPRGAQQLVDVARFADRPTDSRDIERFQNALRHSGHDDDARQKGGTLPLQPLQKLEAVDVRHHEIEKNDRVGAAL